MSVSRILGCGVRGVCWYRCLVRVGFFELVRGCCRLEGGISVGGDGGWEVVFMVAIVLVGC